MRVEFVLYMYNSNNNLMKHNNSLYMYNSDKDILIYNECRFRSLYV